MTQPKISAEAWEQAVSDFVKEAPKHLRAQSMYDSAWIKQRARELTAAQPAAGIDELLHHIRNCTHCRWCRLETRNDAIAALESFAASHSGDEQQKADQEPKDYQVKT